jgi:hypothetical protein
LALLFLPVVALARAGGGEGYSGGSSGGGGDGGGELIFFLIRIWIELVIRYPTVGVPLTIVILYVLYRINKAKKAAGQSWDSVARRPAAPPIPPRATSKDFESIRPLDPQFSVVLFEDFAYALYARAHQARANRRDLDALAPYLSPGVRAQLEQRPPAGVPVTAVIVGAMRTLSVELPAPSDTAGQVQVVLEYEANLTLGADRAQYVKERWTLVRNAGVQTKAPEAVTSFRCPSCGAPFDPAGAAAGDRCSFCGQVVSGGRFDWSVSTAVLLQAEERPPALVSNVAEQGTSFPTVFHPALRERRAELLNDDPASTDEALQERLRLIYDRLNAAWTGLDLQPVRPFVSDGLFDYLQYWIDAYQRQGLRNVLEGMRMTEAVLTKVIRDVHYDSLTFRIWGTGRDYVVRQADNQRVSGDPKKDREYTEYWTLIRGANVKGTPRTDSTCPNCGAPLDQVNMAGECGHCGAKITRGDFDWVLSKIEQDDSYSG